MCQENKDGPENGLTWRAREQYHLSLINHYNLDLGQVETARGAHHWLVAAPLLAQATVTMDYSSNCAV